jgi:hypothetical protein
MFGKSLDLEHLFVLRYSHDEQTFADLDDPDRRGIGSGRPLMAIAPLLGPEELENPWPRPDLRVVEPFGEWAGPIAGISQLPAIGARTPHHGPSRAVRRRRAALGVLVLALVGLVLPIRLLAGAPASAQGSSLLPSAASTLPVSSQAGEGTFYVVQSGDTVSSIAQRLDPANPKLAAQEISRVLGSSTVVPGEHLQLR